MPTIVSNALNQKTLAVLESNIQLKIQDDGHEVHGFIDLTDDDDDDDVRHHRRCQEIQAMCLDFWSEISFNTFSSSSKNLAYKGKSAQTILEGRTLIEVRNQQNRLTGQGGKEVITALLLNAGVEGGIQGTALENINQLRRWICSHRIPAATQEGSVVIVPETIMSSELTLRSIVTLEEGRWINSEVINNYLVTHALNTGASCGHFPDPLPGVPSKVFYTDTFFLPTFVMGKHKWLHNIFDYDYIVAPCHVNNNHYVTVLVNMGSFQLESWDSLGYEQAYLRSIILEWLNSEVSNSLRLSGDFGECGGLKKKPTWTSRAVACPRQDNGDDCGCFTLLAATYSHLGVPVADAYCQRDIPVVRKQLVALAVAMGNLFREGQAWAPFQ